METAKIEFIVAINCVAFHESPVVIHEITPSCVFADFAKSRDILLVVAVVFVPQLGKWKFRHTSFCPAAVVLKNAGIKAARFACILPCFSEPLDT